MSRGLVAAFDTSGPLGSVAVAREGRVLARRFLLERGQHGSRLVPALEAALKDAGGELRDVEDLVVGSGPGSFTGIRVAAATARGLVWSLGLRLHAYSSLMAAAFADASRLPSRDELPQPLRGPEDLPAVEMDAETVRLALFDARSDRAYAAAYRIRDARAEELRAPGPVTMDGLLAEALPEGTVFCGDGALRHAERLREDSYTVAPPPLGVPTAEGLLRLLEVSPEAALVSEPARWTPDYLRPVGARPVLAGGADEVPAG